MKRRDQFLDGVGQLPGLVQVPDQNPTRLRILGGGGEDGADRGFEAIPGVPRTFASRADGRRQMADRGMQRKW